eukprot:SAG31_NODE_2352_length_5882_cov_3.464465_3_plen_80_part_00
MKLHYETSTSLPSEVVTVAELKNLLRRGIVVRTVTFSCFMGLFLLNLPYSHREIDYYFLVFYGTFRAESPMCAPREIRD